MAIVFKLSKKVTSPWGYLYFRELNSKRMQRRKHRLLIFFLSYIPLCTLHAWVQRCLWGPLLCQSGVWCLLGHAVIVLLRQKPKKRNTRVDSAVTDGWKEWEKGWRGSMCVCVCLCVHTRTCVCVFWFVSVFNRALLWEKLNRWVHITRRCNRTEARQPWVQDIYNNIGYIMTITKDLIA